MANWCSTILTFYSESEEQINKLHDVLSELDEGESLLSNGFGNLWLGNILHRFGFDWEKIYCRGSITHYDDEVFQDQDGRFYFEIHQEDAWSPLVEVWDTVLSRPDFCDVEYVYVAEEPGCGIYINSDTSGLFYTDTCMVDAYIDEKDSNEKTREYDCSQYFDSIDDCLDYLCKISEAFGNRQEFASLDDANDWFQDLFLGGSSCIVAHEYEAE